MTTKLSLDKRLSTILNYFCLYFTLLLNQSICRTSPWYHYIPDIGDIMSMTMPSDITVDEYWNSTDAPIIELPSDEDTVSSHYNLAFMASCGFGIPGTLITSFMPILFFTFY